MGWLLWHPHLKDRFHWTRPLSLCLLVWDPCIFFVSSPSYIYIYTVFPNLFAVFLHQSSCGSQEPADFGPLDLGQRLPSASPRGRVARHVARPDAALPAGPVGGALRLQELTAGPKVNGMEKVTFPRRAVDFWEMNILKKVA